MLLTGCSGVGATVDRGVDANGALTQVAPAERGDPITLRGTDLDGRPIDLADYRGKPLVVNIWGSWCGPCTLEAPLLVEAARELSGTAGFVGVTNREVDTTDPLAFERTYGIPYPSVFDPEGRALLAFRGVSAPTFAPTTLVLDAEGRYAASFAGAVTSKTTLVDLVDDVAAGK